MHVTMMVMAKILQNVNTSRLFLDHVIGLFLKDEEDYMNEQEQEHFKKPSRGHGNNCYNKYPITCTRTQLLVYSWPTHKFLNLKK